MQQVEQNRLYINCNYICATKRATLSDFGCWRWQTYEKIYKKIGEITVNMTFWRWRVFYLLVFQQNRSAASGCVVRDHRGFSICLCGTVCLVIEAKAVLLRCSVRNARQTSSGRKTRTPPPPKKKTSGINPAERDESSCRSELAWVQTQKQAPVCWRGGGSLLLSCNLGVCRSRSLPKLWCLTQLQK